MALTCPPYLIAGAVTIALSWSSGKWNERTWHITVSKAVAIVGFVLAAATLNAGARYFAMVVFAIGTCTLTPDSRFVSYKILICTARWCELHHPRLGQLHLLSDS